MCSAIPSPPGPRAVALTAVVVGLTAGFRADARPPATNDLLGPIPSSVPGSVTGQAATPAGGLPPLVL